MDIAAPRDVVYAMTVAPYAERRPRAMAEKVHILERSERMVLAAHYTAVGNRLTAVTVETVRFDPPASVRFRLVRGPVPVVTETFDLESCGRGTRLTYTGELGTDLGRLGELWGDVVARSWTTAVEASLELIKTESERRAGPSHQPGG
ncbi:SRPBCC family protein [Cumulibacter manganitolerans]|uniref:SRPBCC family protein n=1 Tax=Cumulibacter manganitolerans TaxID=1884992 RepID=UPI001E64D563|nr:SRPBCC family protein [Cumulibacter manganitolerans]